MDWHQLGSSEDGGLYDKALFGDREPILLRQVVGVRGLSRGMGSKALTMGKIWENAVRNFKAMGWYGVSTRFNILETTL